MSDERVEMNEEQPLRQEAVAAPKTRLELLKIAGVAAGAVAGAKMLSPGAASAANGDPLTLGVGTNCGIL